MIQYNFCPQCKTETNKSSTFPKCPKCKITFYKNSKPTVGGFPVKNGKVLLAIRGEEPFKGTLDIIGGFLEWKEHPEDGLKREFFEETGVKVRILDLLGIYMDEYPSTGDATQNTFYIVELENESFKPMDDISELRWIDIKGYEKYKREMGFNNLKEALNDLKKWYKENSGRGGQN